jgi:hypothetical protein
MRYLQRTIAGWQTQNERQGTVWQVTEVLCVDNGTDRSYVASVIVDQTDSRYFEVGQSRMVSLMFTVSRR